MLQTISTQSYDQYIDFCATQSTYQAIKKTYHLSPQNTSTLLKSYAFRFFPQEVMSLPIAERDRSIILASIAISKLAESSLISSPSSLSLLRSSLHSYQLQLQQWLKLDIERVIVPFVDKYQQLRALRIEVQNERRFFTSELKQLVDMSYLQLIAQIATLGGDSALSQIDNLLLQTPDLAFRQQFRADSIRAFWLTFAESLPSYHALLPLLIDFIHRYELLLPSRPDLLQSMTERLNLPLVAQRIAENAISLQDLRDYMTYILEVSKALGSAESENRTEQLFSAIINSEEQPLCLLERFFTALFIYYDEFGVVVNEIRALRADGGGRMMVE